MAESKKGAYVFIDGNNFYHNIKMMKIKPGHIDFYRLSRLVCSLFGCDCKKTIYYNSVPSIEDGKKLYWSHMNFLKGLEKLPGFEVKVRKLQRTSTKELLQEKKEALETLNLCPNAGLLWKAASWTRSAPSRSMKRG